MPATTPSRVPYPPRKPTAASPLTISTSTTSAPRATTPTPPKPTPPTSPTPPSSRPLVPNPPTPSAPTVPTRNSPPRATTRAHSSANCPTWSNRACKRSSGPVMPIGSAIGSVARRPRKLSHMMDNRRSRRKPWRRIMWQASRAVRSSSKGNWGF